MRAWYIPAWNGDFRLEPDPSDPERMTLLTIKRPTADERRQLRSLCGAFKDRGWVSDDGTASMLAPPALLQGRVLIAAPLSEVGPVVSSTLKLGPNVLTAVRFRGGKIEVCETSKPPPREAQGASGHPYRTTEKDVEKKAGEEAPASAPSAPSVPEPSDASKALAKKEGAEAAATVGRPTPCCPDCYVDEDELSRPATEVLLAFLDERQHATWSKSRYVVTRGGITGHRYLIAHRNSPIAARNRKITFDLDDQAILHFHDWLVPPAEEVLAAMLILRFREPWLRNEATAFGDRNHVFKNPFGDAGDGVADSTWTRNVGFALGRLCDVPRPRSPRILMPDGGVYDNGWVS